MGMCDENPSPSVVVEMPPETGATAPATDLRGKRKKRVDKEEEDEKEAYSRLMDLLDEVEEKNQTEIYWIIFESTVISGLTAAMACTLTLERMKHNRFLGLRMWQYVMMAMVLFTGLSIIRFVTGALRWATTCWWRPRRDLGYFLKQIKATVDVTIWLCAVLFAWYVWFRPRLKHVYGEVSIIAAHQITRFLIAVCLGALLWLGKNALFLWLEADLHYRQLCNRITSTTLQLHVLQILHNYGMWRFLTRVDDRLKIQELIDRRLERIQEEEEHSKDSTTAAAVTTTTTTTTQKEIEDPKKGDVEEVSEEHLWMKGVNICKELLLVNRETVPVLILQRLCKEYKNQIKLKPLPVSKEIIQNPEDLMEEASKLFFRMKNPKGTVKVVRHRDDDGDDGVRLVELEKKYKDVNREELELFFKRFHGEKCLYVNGKPRIDQKSGRAGFLSLLPMWMQDRVNFCVGNNGQKDAKKESLTSNLTKDKKVNDKYWEVIGRDEFCSWAVQAYRNCWGLKNTLKSSEQIILKLNRMMVAFVLLLSLIIWLLLSQIVDSGQIALLFSPLLAAKFIFSESTKNMFDGLIFALAMHPFNPGDRVIIDGMELLVTEINILSTTFYKYQTREELVYPNSELATTQIINLELIPDQSDKLEFTIPNTIALEDIRDLEIKIQMSLNERKDAYKSKVVKTEMGYENIKMTTHFNYVGSYLTSELKAVHKSDLLSMIMNLVKNMSSSTKENEAPSTCKPYIVQITVPNRVKLKQVDEIIKAAIESAVAKYCDKEGESNMHKIVMHNVGERCVWMAFYVWKMLCKEKQELISKEDLADIKKCIYDSILIKIPNSDNKSTVDGINNIGEAQQGYVAASTDASNINYRAVPKVEIQPIPGVLAIKWKKIDEDGKEIDDVDDKHVEDIKSTIKRYFYKQYFEDDFEVSISKDKNIVEIYAWRKFSHGIDKEKQFQMEKNLQNLEIVEILNKQIELKDGVPRLIKHVISLEVPINQTKEPMQ